ncbi:hypothetical protein [Sphingobium sp.]|uniref:hypothetical protein n=1 Tax=Sphingobium sp. TaxID=1912891 RepID=UPI0028BDD352|nr:hypothetical protein [Sphingobium sp.]
MRSPQILSCLVIAVMGSLMMNILIHDGMDHGVGFDVFLAGAGDPWQLFINNDLVTGLWFMCGWIVLRERGGRVMDVVAWVWMVLWWGNIIVAAYVLRAAWQSGGDWSCFFMGRHAGPSRQAVPSFLVRTGSGLAAIAVALWLARSIAAVRWAGIPTTGYLLGFLPIILTLLLLAFPDRPAEQR